MFDQAERRVFALPPGCDFSSAFLNGLYHRLQGQPPEALARVEVFVNTHRTRRRLLELLQSGPARLLPRIRVITDLSNDPIVGLDLPQPVSALRRRLELSQMIAALLEKEPDLAPPNAMFDLADSLAGLMDEMHGEGVAVERVLDLEISSDFSAHWGRSLTFLNILRPFFSDESEPDNDARQRMVVEHLSQHWTENPPTHPVIVAGSTGSRGATALFMQAVTALPQGAVVLPGFDFDLPISVWPSFADPMNSADHPQAGFYKLLGTLKCDLTNVRPWSDARPSNVARNRLVSLALRPAPVTDQWLIEGPNLADIKGATAKMSLLEAPTQRDEAMAIALRLRAAAELGQKATLISPDRNLTRQVTAALKRWDILPDDSAGRPLPLTPPGVFLRMVSNAIGQRLTSETLLILLKHPLTHTGGGRGQHLLWSRDLELEKLRGGSPFVNFQDLSEWAKSRQDSDKLSIWINWLEGCFNSIDQIQTLDLSDMVAIHRKCAETLAAGALGNVSESELWQMETGNKAAQVFADLEENSDVGGRVSPSVYSALFRSVLNRAEVRETVQAHPLITIWGTLEARVQGADVVILGGLNDGVWPSLPSPDPWLNRKMRYDAGLLLPERRIGLSAHDFQLAIAAPEVVLTRAARIGDAPAVASRWLIRLTNLLAGIGEAGQVALGSMQDRGQYWLDVATKLEQPEFSLPLAQRPSPRLPDALHPRKLSVTRIRTLVRDPYAIYAQYVLKLRKLDPVRREPDAMLRGQAIHSVMQEFIQSTLADLQDDATEKLLEIATRIFEAEVPWPATKRMWLARLARIAEKFVRNEKSRRTNLTPIAFEVKGVLQMPLPDFTLTGTADRIDRHTDGSVVIYDYKSGSVPSDAQVREFDKQLPLEGAIAQAGGFVDLPPLGVSDLVYIGLGSGAKTSSVKLDDDLINQTWEELGKLIAAYRTGKVGYTARARVELLTDAGDYDHLSRFGEWEDSVAAIPEDVT